MQKAGSWSRLLKQVVTGLVTGTINGLMGSGGGMIVVPAMVFLLGAEEQEAHATAVAVILPLTVMSAFFYISSGYVDWNLAVTTASGGAIGGYVGAGLLNKCPPFLVRKIFAVFMIFAALRMLL